MVRLDQNRKRRTTCCCYWFPKFRSLVLFLMFRHLVCSFQIPLNGRKPYKIDSPTILFSSPNTTDKNSHHSDNLNALDTMLKRARQRPVLNNPIYQLQAFLDGPLIPIPIGLILPSLTSSETFVLTRGDAALISFALILHANGAAVGYMIGKITARPLRVVLRPPVPIQMVLAPFWTVLWMIVLDQFL